MFYSAELLALKSHSGLGIVWYMRLTCVRMNVCRLAATLGPKSNAKKLTRKDYGAVDIVKTWYRCIEELCSLSPKQPVP